FQFSVGGSHWSPVICHWLFVIGYLSLVICHWLFVIGYLSLVIARRIFRVSTWVGDERVRLPSPPRNVAAKVWESF
ncbi:MAG: hypothetical protein ACKO38_07245, partial [Planctomycetota bacterium]